MRDLWRPDLTMLILFHGYGQGVLNGPTLIYAILQRGEGHSLSCCPLRHGQAFTLIFKNAITASIAGLFFSGGPPAIGRPPLLFALFAMAARVVAIAINSINTVLRPKTRSDILDKALNAFSPTTTNLDSASTIVIITSRIGMFAASNNCQPRTIFYCCAKAVRQMIFGTYVPSETTTTFGIASNKSDAVSNSVLSTFAPAQPNGLLALAADITKHSQAVKHLACQIFNLFVGDRNDRRKIIGDNCEQWHLWSMILHVVSPPRLSAKPRTLAASLGASCWFLPEYFSTNGRIFPLSFACSWDSLT